MTTDLSALTEPMQETGPECKCGCGEYLPPGSTRDYKRGHKNTPGAAITDPPLAVIDTPYTLADAAKDVPNDADAADQAAPAPIRITRKVQADIQGKLGMMYGLVIMGVDVKDPVCGKALTDNADNITAAMVPIICKSPEMVKWFTKGGGYMIWLQLAMAFLPVIKVAVSHHLTHSIGDDGQPQDGNNPRPALQPDFTLYRAG